MNNNNNKIVVEYADYDIEKCALENGYLTKSFVDSLTFDDNDLVTDIDALGHSDIKMWNQLATKVPHYNYVGSVGRNSGNRGVKGKHYCRSCIGPCLACNRPEDEFAFFERYVHPLPLSYNQYYSKPYLFFEYPPTSLSSSTLQQPYQGQQHSVLLTNIDSRKIEPSSPTQSITNRSPMRPAKNSNSSKSKNWPAWLNEKEEKMNMKNQQEQNQQVRKSKSNSPSKKKK